MSTSHHNPEQDEAAQAFISELMGRTERKWPQGRISGEDDGQTNYAIATDERNRIIRIQFTKPMNWLGLGIDEAKSLRKMLGEKITELEASMTPKKS